MFNMIKLIDLIQESNIATHNDKHWRDHFRDIINCAEEALSSNDPETIATQVANIIEYAEAAGEKHEATWAKKHPHRAVNSNIANSYNGDDSDIHQYTNPI